MYMYRNDHITYIRSAGTGCLRSTVRRSTQPPKLNKFVMIANITVSNVS